MMIRSALASLLLILALAGLVAGGAPVAPPVADEAGMARHMSMPDCDGCPGDAGEALACSAACALVVAGDLGPVPLGLLGEAPARPLRAVVAAAPPRGLAVAPDPPRPRRARL